jgi:hypothetical protein
MAWYIWAHDIITTVSGNGLKRSFVARFRITFPKKCFCDRLDNGAGKAPELFRLLDVYDNPALLAEPFFFQQIAYSLFPFLFLFLS